jgi:hypothetical protein
MASESPAVTHVVEANDCDRVIALQVAKSLKIVKKNFTADEKS